MQRALIAFVTLVILWGLGGCGATGLFQPPQDNADLSFGRLGIFPAEAGRYPEAGRVVDTALVELFKAEKRATQVITPREIEARSAEKNLSRLTREYLRKYEVLNFSDPEMAKKIGEELALDTFIISGVEFYGYSREGTKDVAKAGVKLVMIEASTGKVLWRQVKYESKEYLWWKPALPEVLQNLLKKMVSELEPIKQ